ncbi:MAG: hypothetical protein AB7Q42_00770 [Acidimicrobiia bacterium]
MTNWSMNLDVARQRHSTDIATAERHRLVRRSRRARRRAGTAEQPSPGAMIVPLPPSSKTPQSQDTPDRLAS